MRTHGTRWRWWSTSAFVALVIAFAVMIISCGPDPQPDAERADCAKIEKTEVPADRGLTALVVDNSASTATGDLPPRILTELRQAQSRGEALALVAVDGAGRQAAVVRKIALEPNPGKDSATADRARPIVLDCVVHWARAEQMRPGAQGSAILDAIAAAARQNPSTLLVVSDGVNNVGQFDLNTLGFDAPPGPLAEELFAANGLAPELKGRKIIWTGLGETAQTLPQSARTNLAAVWEAVLGRAQATVEFDNQAGKRGTAPENLPADPLVVPEVKKLTLSCGIRQSIPAALLFAADSAALLPDSDQVLREIAAELSARPALSALVEGHTADYGDQDGKQRLSEDRAKAVTVALSEMGTDGTRLASVGHGSDRPKAGESPAAAANRRVEITVGTKGCGR